MICPNCKAENIEGADECSNCGTALYGLDTQDAENRDNLPAFIKQKIEVLPKRPLVSVKATDPVAYAVRLMQNGDVGSVVVLDEDSFVGIITTWDILHRVAGPNEDLSAVSCREVMTSDPICLRDDDSLALALNVMSSGGFRHVPILKDDKPYAVIGVGDVFAHISSNLI